MDLTLRKITELPSNLNPHAFDYAVERFVSESNPNNVPYNAKGFTQQTIDNIAATVLFKHPQGHDVWLSEDEGQVAAYALCHVSKDVDNEPCYWMTQAYVAPKWRNTEWVREWRDTLTEEAKARGCKHIIIPSSRGVKGYCRFMGDGWHPYVTLLKKDI